MSPYPSDSTMLTQGSSPQVGVVVWVGVLIVLLVGAGLGVLWFRRKLLSRQDDPGSQGSLMEDLRRMRDRGQLSKEEFDAARRAMTRRLAGELKGPAGPKGRTRPGPPGSA